MAKNEEFRPIDISDSLKALERSSTQLANDLKQQSAADMREMNKQISANQDKRIQVAAEEAEKNRNSFNINNFRAEINRAGILPAHSFLLYINPRGVPGSTVTANALVLRMENAQIPGVSLMTQDVFRYGYGPNIRMPHGAQYNVMSATFIVDGAAENYKFFYDWLNLVVNHESKGGGTMTDKNPKTKMYPYQVGYKRATMGGGGYALGQMNLAVYDRSNNKAMNVTFYDVYPFMLSDLDLKWSDENTPIRATVQFVFTDLTMTFDKSAEMADIISAENPQNEIASIKNKKDGILSALGRQIQVGKQAAVDTVMEEGARTVERTVSKVIKSIF